MFCVNSLLPFVDFVANNMHKKSHYYLIEVDFLLTQFSSTLKNSFIVQAIQLKPLYRRKP